MYFSVKKQNMKVTHKKVFMSITIFLEILYLNKCNDLLDVNRVGTSPPNLDFNVCFSYFHICCWQIFLPFPITDKKQIGQISQKASI